MNEKYAKNISLIDRIIEGFFRYLDSFILILIYI